MISFKQRLTDREIFIIHYLVEWYNRNNKIEFFDYSKFQFNYWYGSLSMWEHNFYNSLKHSDNQKFNEIIYELKNIFIDNNTQKEEYDYARDLPTDTFVGLIILMYLNKGINILNYSSEEFSIRMLEIQPTRIPEECCTVYEITLNL